MMVRASVRAYLAAQQRSLERRNPNWLENLFNDKEYCSYCGQSWRTENCSLCTSCSATYPPWNERRELKLLANGNRGRSSCYRGEIVG
jgi:hypothetical protein